MLKENRGLIKYFLLNVITFGIYGLVFWHTVANDANLICREDGKKTAGIIKRIILNALTLHIYGIFWDRHLAARIENYCMRRNLETRCHPTSVTLWSIFFFPVARWKLMKGMNVICADFNRTLQQPMQNAQFAMPVQAPVAALPMNARPTAAQPMVAQPVAARPAAAQPVVAQPVAARPAVAKPVTAQPVANRPAANPAYQYGWSYSQSAPLPHTNVPATYGAGYVGPVAAQQRPAVAYAQPVQTGYRPVNGQQAAAMNRYAMPSVKPMSSAQYGVTM